MIRKILVGVFGMALLAGPIAARCEAAQPAASVLTANYLRYLLLNHVKAQGAEIVAQAPAAAKSGLQARLDNWQDSFQEAIRVDLEKNLGADARSQFESFVSDFTRAERASDSAYLEQLAAQTSWPGPVADGFEAFRRWGMQQWVSGDMQSGVEFLSALIPPVAQAPTQPMPPRNPLRDAEGESLEYGGDSAGGATLQRFAGMRDERRQKALEQAQAGMQQVAAEREAWEQEYASRMEARAQAEAEAKTRQAERLAATEEEALEQRRNSFKAKAVGVLAGVAGATVSGFTGAIGGRAADEAVNAIFGERK
ncbi:MAG: hypothetical protein M5U15_06525 [Kiritimatiellae bacterium]|nr:hypothetical protein [Kiritimatiellia bacterium]